MAKKPPKPSQNSTNGATHDDAAPPAAGGNVTEETVRDYARRLRSAKADTEEKRIVAAAARKAVSTCVGFERAIYKDAKRAGIETGRLELLMNHWARDPEEVAREMAQLAADLKAVGHVTDGNDDIFTYAAKNYERMASGMASSPRPSDGDDDLDQIKELGGRAGKAGKPSTDNPYDDDGSPEHLAWLGGWRDGQAENLGPLAGQGAPTEGATAH